MLHDIINKTEYISNKNNLTITLPQSVSSNPETLYPIMLGQI